MKILILGGGLMGPAAAYNCLIDPDVTRVTICDRSQEQLDAAAYKLSELGVAEKLETALLDLNDEAVAVKLISGFDAAVAALPQGMTDLVVRLALKANTPLIDLARPTADEFDALKAKAKQTGGLAILGCGVEPGLTEIMARYLAEKLDQVNELHILCGGVPEHPTPPLGYKIVFGGRQMPLHESDAPIVRDGQLELVPRYSGVEPVTFPGVGECEAWHEGFMPWLLDLPQLKNLRLGTQKTVRWPGYGDKVTLLKEIGLLSREPIEVDGVQVAPKRLLDEVLYPRVRLEEGERDITLFRVVAIGVKEGRPRTYKIEMIDRFDEELGFSSMARTTSFTGAIVARMVARGDLKGTGALPPEQLVSGPLFDQLVGELANANILFDISVERVRQLGQER